MYRWRRQGIFYMETRKWETSIQPSHLSSLIFKHTLIHAYTTYTCKCYAQRYVEEAHKWRKHKSIHYMQLVFLYCIYLWNNFSFLLIFTAINWCLAVLFLCFMLYNVKSNNTDPITTWFLSIVRSNFILDGFVNLDGITFPS